jgi:hypothetical protein
MAPTRAALDLDHGSHSPRVFSDGHGSEVDLWGVGKLLLDARKFVLGISADMIAIGERLVASDVGALQALEDVRSMSDV